MFLSPYDCSLFCVAGALPWANLVSILEEKNGADPELLVYTVTLINKTLAALPDQDSFYDVTDALEQQGMEALVQRLLGTAGTDVDLRAQLVLYEVGWAARTRLGDREGAVPQHSIPPTWASATHIWAHFC